MQAALKEFRKEALIRKQQVKEKKLPASQFISWMIGQEAVIEGFAVSRELQIIWSIFKVQP